MEQFPGGGGEVGRLVPWGRVTRRGWDLLALLCREGAETLHPGFVVGVTVDGTRVLVEWDGSALVKGERYRLETLATLTGGLAVEALTEVHCIA